MAAALPLTPSASDRRPVSFPEGFLWGAATSAYQYEGGNLHSDWYEWERLGRVRERCGRAVDFWERYPGDLDLAASLGMNAFRVSVEWGRVEPERGRFDDAVLSHYADIVHAIRDRGMQPMVVLWHFTNPSWLAARREAPWVSGDSPELFGRYARRVAEALGDSVAWWATLNEANTYADHGFIQGDWPPGRHRDYLGGYRSYVGLARAHSHARNAIHDVVGPAARVGLTHVLPWVHPASTGAGVWKPHAAWYRWMAAWAFLDRVRGELDWLGVQYYYDVPTTTFGHRPDDGDPPRTDMGWRIVPKGLYHVTMQTWERYGVPIIITENGLADCEDEQRGRFLIDHLLWLERAIAQGADVRGYLHWSLLDNFEWAAGFGPRFGLVDVDRATLVRAPRPSAALFERIARANGVPDDLDGGSRYSNGADPLTPR